MRVRRGRRRRRVRKRRTRINYKRLAISLSIMIGITFIIANHFDDKHSIDKGTAAYAGAKNDDEIGIENQQELANEEENADIFLEEEISDKSHDVEENDGKVDKEVPKTEDYDKGNEENEQNKENIINAENNIKPENTSNNDENIDTSTSSIKNNYKDIFDKDVFVGDSITGGLSAYELIKESNVFSGLGVTVLHQKEKLDEIVKTEPENIYILLGVNDALTGISSEKFANNYAQLVQAIKEKLPSSNVYIQSILPVSSNVAIKKPLLKNERINEFNTALRSMAEVEGAIYLDIASVTDDYSSLYARDGIHLKSSFYKLWLNYLISNTK